MLSISERVELDNIVRDLDRIYSLCNDIVKKNPLQLSEEIALATAVGNNASKIRDQLKASVEQYNTLDQGPFPNQQTMFDLQTFIYKLVLTDYKSEILPYFQDLSEKIIEKENDLISKAEEQRLAGKNIPEKSELEKDLAEAKAEVQSAKNDNTPNDTFNNISSFAVKAKPYVEKIIKGANIALSILAMLNR